MPSAARLREAPKPRPRDREETCARILDAAAALIARDGFRGFGVSALAKAASVDKVLIYRYFDGLDGVVAALGERLDLWLGAVPEVPAGASYRTFVGILLDAYLDALRSNPLVQQVLAWELVDDSALTRSMQASRSRAVGLWFRALRAQAGAPPDGLDAAAINAVLLAALHHLVLSDRSLGEFAGIDLRSADGWPRIRAALLALVDVYAAETAA